MPREPPHNMFLPAAPTPRQVMVMLMTGYDGRCSVRTGAQRSLCAHARHSVARTTFYPVLLLLGGIGLFRRAMSSHHGITPSPFRRGTVKP